MLVIFEEKEGKRGPATISLFVGAALIILGTNLGDRVTNLNVGGNGLEMAFAPQAASLTPQQVAGAQRAQQIKLAPLAKLPSNQNNPFASLADQARVTQEARTARLHLALANQGFTPAPDPSADLSKGSIVRIGLDGKVAVQFSRQQAFPDLKVRPSSFDFQQFTSMGDPKAGFTTIGLFECQQGFREDMDLVSYAFTRVAPVANNALQQEPSLHVIRSVMGCYGKEIRFDARLSQSLDGPEKRYILGFQLATAVRR